MLFAIRSQNMVSLSSVRLCFASFWLANRGDARCQSSSCGLYLMTARYISIASISQLAGRSFEGFVKKNHNLSSKHGKCYIWWYILWIATRFVRLIDKLLARVSRSNPTPGTLLKYLNCTYPNSVILSTRIFSCVVTLASVVDRIADFCFLTLGILRLIVTSDTTPDERTCTKIRPPMQWPNQVTSAVLSWQELQIQFRQRL